MITQMHVPMNGGFLLAFLGYLGVVVLVGIVAYRATRNFSDYVLGGRRLGGAVAALSAGASDMSSWLLMGLPGVIYASNFNYGIAAIGLTVGAYGCWKWLAKRLRVYSEVANDSVTVPAYLDNRFRDKSRLIRVIAALATLCFFIFYVAAGLYAAGVLLEMIFPVEYTTALWLGAAVILLYTSMGGFLAVSWTDFFQGTLMLFCLLLVPFFAMENYGGWKAGMYMLLEVHPDYFDWTKGLTISKGISLFSWGLGYFGMPHILVRFMAVKTTKEIPLARMVCMWWMSLSMVGAILVGIVGAAQFCNCPLDNSETVFIALSGQMLTPWMMGLLLAAILSSSMCAIDSQMLAASSALTEDIYRTLFRRAATQAELVWVGRVAVVIIAMVALYIARKPNQRIMDLVAFAWAGLGATFAAPITLSLFWKRTTREGVIAGMLCGFCMVVVWHFGKSVDSVYEIVPGVLASLGGVVVTSLLTALPSPEILEEFEQVRLRCQEESGSRF